MAVVRLATLASGDDVAALLQRLDALERRLGGSTPEGGAGGAPPARGRPSAASEPPRGPRAAERPAPERAAPAPERASEPTPAGAAAPALVDRLRALAAERDRPLGAALEGATIVEDGDRLRIAVAQAFAANRLQRRRADLEAVCVRLFGRPMRIEIAGPGEPDPSSRADGEEELRRRRREALAHPAVNAALEILGGEVLEIRTLGDDRA
jgi:DNA polymerase-3 subunit gamma/tau